MDDQQIRQIVADFAIEFWRQLRWHAGQMIPGLDMHMLEQAGAPMLSAADILDRTMEPQEWLEMARYGAGLLNSAERTYIYEICQGMAEWLFAIPGEASYEIPGVWYQTPMGALWAAAYVRATGDELITITEAARLAGITTQAIYGRIARGALRAYVNPAAPNPQREHRLVRRRDIEVRTALDETQDEQ